MFAPRQLGSRSVRATPRMEFLLAGLGRQMFAVLDQPIADRRSLRGKNAKANPPFLLPRHGMALFYEVVVICFSGFRQTRRSGKVLFSYQGNIMHANCLWYVLSGYLVRHGQVLDRACMLVRAGWCAFTVAPYLFQGSHSHPHPLDPAAARGFHQSTDRKSPPACALGHRALHNVRLGTPLTPPGEVD